MDTKMMQRAGAIGVGLLLSSSLAATAQEPVAGYTWERFEPPAGTGGVSIDDFSEGPGGGLAIFGYRGTGEPDTEGITVWTSGDGAQTWTEKTLPESEYEYLYDYHDREADEATFTATTHGGLLVAARSVPGGTKQTYILTSPDGVHWQVATKLKNVRADDLIATPDGLAIIGLDFRKADGFGKSLAGYPSLWLSDDGTDWVAHEITTPMYTKKHNGTQGLDRIARADDGTWMASGFTAHPKTLARRPSIWIADAALEWSEVTPPLVHDARKDGWRLFGSTRAGFLFAGWILDREAGISESGLWLTSDGTDWEQVAETGVPGPGASETFRPGPEVVAVTESGAIAWAAPFAWTDPSMRDELRRVLAGSPVYSSSDVREWKHDPANDLFEGVWPGFAHATPDGHVLFKGVGYSVECVHHDPRCVFDAQPADVAYIGGPE